VSFNSTAAFASQDVGEAILVQVTGISLDGADAGNYNLLQTSVDISANITKRPLTVTAEDQTRLVGEPDPTFTFTYSGFAPGETSAVIDVAPTCTVSGPHDAAGDYDIVCSGGLDNNYSFNYIKGTLKVTAVEEP